MSGDPDDFLIVPEAAVELRMAKRTLDNHRWKGTGPKFRRHGGRIVYRRGDLLSWSEERAARVAARNTKSRTSSSGHSGRNRPRARRDRGEHPKTTVEYQRKHPNWSLRADKPSPAEGPTGGYPPP
ncbi:helix-turn-helix domain-containing protein [Hyphomicrobium sp. CS1BSMeth3]|uniref:helix-turn-helix transcriptional regulator n=1 Tax=Hyphomicrobium sp. CS1BSMeth3 TaxID=1892844 RepID=UPI001FCD48FF|nr:helix-turn-helix domain-containing protein [Hyphomicrobium sp. CS1BSMeth3]